MNFDEKTGKELNNNEKPDIIASIYAPDGKFYGIGADKKIYQINPNEIIQVHDRETKEMVYRLFTPGKIDVIDDEPYGRD